MHVSQNRNVHNVIQSTIGLMMVIKPVNAWILIIKMVNNVIFASLVVWLVITVITVTLVMQMLTL